MQLNFRCPFRSSQTPMVPGSVPPAMMYWDSPGGAVPLQGGRLLRRPSMLVDSHDGPVSQSGHSSRSSRCLTPSLKN